MLGEGVGTPLLEAAVGAATSAGYGRMLVKTESDNQRALGFYRSRGSTDVGEEAEDLDGVELTLALLRRDLISGA